MDGRRTQRQGRTTAGWLWAALLGTLALLVLGRAAPAEDDGRWMPSLEAAQQRANQERKPLLCVFVAKGSVASARLARDLDKSKSLRPLLDEFVLVKLDPAVHRTLVDQYHIQLFPTLLFMTGGARPLKLVVGPMPIAKIRGQIKEALAKWEKLKNPWKNLPQTRAPRRAPVETPEAPRQLHPSSCPTRCEHCGPAIERALAWLARRQGSKGRWTKLDGEVEDRNEEGKILTRSIDHIDVALTAVAGLALLAEGSTPTTGKYARHLRRAVSFLRKSVRPDGVVTNETGNDWLYTAHSIFETSLAAVFLSEAQQAAPEPETLESLRTIAAGLVAAQDRRLGAWGYSHDAVQHQMSNKRGWRLLATTHVAMTALNAMRDVGVSVEDAVLAKGAVYLRTCLGRDGTFTYRTELRWGNGYPGATSGALFAMARSGVVPADEIARLRDLYRRQYAAIDGFGEHWWFFLFFGGLAMNDAGEGSWQEYHARFRDVVVARQKESGAWDDPDGKPGSVFATALATIFLQFEHGHLDLLARRSGERPVEAVRKPRYLKPPDPVSRVKVFEYEGRYLADLVLSTDGPADAAWFEHLADGVRAANRILYDVTDGQLALHHVEIGGGGERWDEADVRILTDFYTDANVPGGGVHGITMVAKLTEVRGGREVAGKRIGEWVKLPYYLGGTQNPVPWQNRGLVRVFAHELCHYLLGVQDESGAGGVYCACIVGDRTTSELCKDDDHTDDRRELSCWSQAQTLYPKLRVPTVCDPGPWDPPIPQVVLPAE